MTRDSCGDADNLSGVGILSAGERDYAGMWPDGDKYNAIFVNACVIVAAMAFILRH